MRTITKYDMQNAKSNLQWARDRIAEAKRTLAVTRKLVVQRKLKLARLRVQLKRQQAAQRRRDALRKARERKAFLKIRAETMKVRRAEAKLWTAAKRAKKPYEAGVGALLLPREGVAFHAYKRVLVRDDVGINQGLATVKLLVPATAKRIMGNDAAPAMLPPIGSKCRASEALVVEIVPQDGLPPGAKTFHSDYAPGFSYHVGKTVKPKNRFALDKRQTCASGIHFFMHKKDADNYL